jgi:shikimate dehydrogenase
MHIDGSTTLVGVFGHPIAHTASPPMHNAAFAALEMNWAYLAFDVDPANLRSALLGARDMGLRGVNLTVPHKILALDIVDEVDADARKLGAVNTVSIEAGKLRGLNTDGYGIAKAIREEFNFGFKSKRVLVLGAGGAGRAIAVKASLDGALRVYIANRTLEKIAPIMAEISRTKSECRPTGLAVEALTPVMADVDLVINATAVGLKEGETLGLPASLFTPEMFVYDTIYRPAETAFLKTAAEAGARTANGLSMLLHQGIKAFDIWTGRKAPLAVMRRALRAAVSEERPA